MKFKHRSNQPVEAEVRFPGRDYNGTRAPARFWFLIWETGWPCSGIHLSVSVYMHFLFVRYTSVKNLPFTKNGILPFATAWMGLEGIMLGEISQSEKDTHQCAFIYK